MQEEMEPRLIYVGLEAIIQFQDTGDTLGCVIQDIAEDYTQAMVMTSDPRICTDENIELQVILLAERSPIKCTGKIIWHSKDDKGYLARILIIHFSRIERRRFELAIAQKKAFDNSGRSAGVSSQRFH